MLWTYAAVPPRLAVRSRPEGSAAFGFWPISAAAAVYHSARRFGAGAKASDQFTSFFLFLKDRPLFMRTNKMRPPGGPQTNNSTASFENRTNTHTIFMTTPHKPRDFDGSPDLIVPTMPPAPELAQRKLRRAEEIRKELARLRGELAKVLGAKVIQAE